jgi:hypothetical protein
MIELDRHVPPMTTAKRQSLYPHPLIADPSILRYWIERVGPLCLAPWRAVPLICPNCPEPHMVGLAYCRIGDVNPWALFTTLTKASA